MVPIGARLVAVDRPSAFEGAVRQRMSQLGLNQRDLAKRVAERHPTKETLSAQSITNWLREPENLPPASVFALESALELAPGALSWMLGYIPFSAESSEVINALERDPRLTPELRHTVRGAYEAAVAAYAEHLF